MTLRLAYLFCLLITLTACSTSPEHIRTLNRVVGKKSKQLCIEENLGIMGTGGATMPKIEEVFISFTAERRVDLPEARRLCVRCIEELRSAINSTEILQPYLIEYPFPISGMDISVTFVGEDGNHVAYGCVYLGTGGVSYVHQCGDLLCYASYNPRTKHLEDYYDEPYSEALAIVQQENPGLLPPQDPMQVQCEP